MSSAEFSLLRLHVVVEADPCALVRVLERFQNLNVLPRRVIAEMSTNGTVHIEVDISDLPEATLTLIAEKLKQHPCVENAYWHRP